MLSSLPFLAGLLITGPNDGSYPQKIIDAVRQLETGTAGERVMAAEQLRDIGPGAADAIRPLAHAAEVARRGSNAGDTEARRASRHLHAAAVDALVAIGPKSAPALVELLAGEKGDISVRLAGHIGSFGPDAGPVVPALAKLLADDNQDFRVQVAGSLEKIGPAAEPAIPALVDLFLSPKNKDDNGWASGGGAPPPRVAAVRALVRIGPKAGPALADKVLPALVEELKTGDHAPGGRTEDVLKVLGEAGAALVPAVVAVARKDNHRLNRENAGRALLGLGAAGRKAFGELLADKDVEMRRAMVAALGSHLLGERFPTYYRFVTPPLDIGPLVPGLVAALIDTEPEHRLAAAELLSGHPDKVPLRARDAIFELIRDPGVQKLMGRDGFLPREPDLAGFGEPGFRALTALLDADSVGVRRFVMWQLRDSRELAAGALPKLRTLADHPDTGLALRAAYTAAELSLDPKDAAVLAGSRFARNPDPGIRKDTANHLQWLGPLGVPHLDALIPLLGDKDEEVVQAAAAAIHYRAPKGSAASRALADRKLVPNGALRFVSGVARPEQESPTVPDLIAATTAGDDHKRVNAALDLGDLGPAAKDALPALKKLLLDPDPNLRFAAGYAVARISGDLPSLRRLLTNELGRFVRGQSAAWVAGLAFERLPPEFSEQLPLVAQGLERGGDGTVLLAGLKKYGPKAKDAVPALRKILRGPEMPGHHYFGSELKPACEALGAIGPAARDALPELRQLLDTGGVEKALAARDAIQKITGGK